MLLKPLKIDDHPLAQGTSDERPHVQTCPAQDRIASVVSRASEDTSSVTQSRAPNVTSQRRSIEAIDIESDGILHNHNGHYDSCGTPRFDRSLQPKSMRIMFCLMPDVFAYGRVGNTRSNGRCDESQKFASCTVCRRTNPVDQVSAEQILSFDTDHFRSVLSRRPRPVLQSTVQLAHSRLWRQAKSVVPNTRHGGTPPRGTVGGLLNVKSTIKDGNLIMPHAA